MLARRCRARRSIGWIDRDPAAEWMGIRAAAASRNTRQGLTARTQQPAKLPTIGLFSSSTSATTGQLVTAFVRRLRELGWIEGRTINIEYRWTQGSRERATE